MIYKPTLDRAGTPESNNCIAFVGISESVRRMRRLGGFLLLAMLSAAGPWRAAAIIGPPVTVTNKVSLSWGSLGSGTRYYVQTSTNLQAWTTATNTTATNVSLTFVGDQEMMFSLSASNTPPQSATLAWSPSVPATNVAGYYLYYGGATGIYTNQINIGLATNGVVSNLVAGSTYYFAATAYTSTGLESGYSDEVAWQSQSPMALKIQRLP